jgi:hypothetical protein
VTTRWSWRTIASSSGAKRCSAPIRIGCKASRSIAARRSSIRSATSCTAASRSRATR